MFPALWLFPRDKAKRTQLRRFQRRFSQMTFRAYGGIADRLSNQFIRALSNLQSLGIGGSNQAVEGETTQCRENKSNDIGKNDECVVWISNKGISLCSRRVDDLNIHPFHIRHEVLGIQARVDVCRVNERSIIEITVCVFAFPGVWQPLHGNHRSFRYRPGTRLNENAIQANRIYRDYYA